MAFSGLRLTTIPTTRLSFTKTTGVGLTAKTLPCQIRCKGDSEYKAPKQLSLSRRHAIVTLTTLSAAVIGINSPDIAEARGKKDEMRRKIKEKLEELRAKAGLSKKKEDNNQSSAAPPLEPPPLPLPDPPRSLGRSLVEAANGP